MPDEHGTREDGAAAEIEAQTVFSAQVVHMLNDEHFIVDGPQTLCRYVLERKGDLVMQLGDDTAHELYDRVRQEYNALDEQFWHTKAAVGHLAETFREVERHVKMMKCSRAHRENATKAFEPASTHRDPSRTSGYQVSRSQKVLPAAEVAQSVDAVSTRAEDPFKPTSTFPWNWSSSDFARSDQPPGDWGVLQSALPMINSLAF